MTVKEVFNKAYGELPEGAKCYLGWVDCAAGEKYWGCSVIEFPTPNDIHRDRDIWVWDSADEQWRSLFDDCEDPMPATYHISNNPATYYREMTDYRFDRVLDGEEN